MFSPTKKIAVIGGTSCIALHCVRCWLADASANVMLVGRSQDRLSRATRDLSIRFPSSRIEYISADLEDTSEISRVVKEICATSLPDVVLIAHGSLPDQNECQVSLDACREALLINSVSPVLWAEAFVGYMHTGTSETRLAIIGSVAGDRGRHSNYVYGSAKGLVERYTQGLQHRVALAQSKLVVTLVKPGPTETPMTSHLTDLGISMAPVEQVAKEIVAGLNCKKSVVYAPSKWRLIMFLIRSIPSVMFNRMRI